MVGAVQTDQTTEVACPMGLRSADAQRIFGERLQKLVRTGQSLFATLSKGDEGDAAELDLLRGRNVLVAVRNGETPEAARDWLDYHTQHQGADAALIVDRDPPESSNFARRLGKLVPDVSIVVVTFAVPLGLHNMPDARDPALAPGAPKRDTPPNDPWHAPLREGAIVELLRHRFLASAAAVALLDIADMVLPSDAGTVFELARESEGQAVFLRGVEAYPWRLRQGKAAPHGDHIARRRGERRRLSSWVLVPTGMPEDAAFRFGRPPRGISLRDDLAVSFSRSMGVVFPAVSVKALVQKSTLVETPLLVDFTTEKLGASPIRLPSPDVIPPRPASGKVTVITTMKNEGPFILDWIAHNRAIGITSHLVYTNDCEDGTDQLLDALSEAGVVRRDNPFRETGKVPQYAAFRASENEDVVANADWLLTLDVDEYVNIHAGDGKLSDLLDAVPDAHLVSMPWRLFGNSDIHAFADQPVTTQFLNAAPAFAPRPIHAWAVKTLYRNAGLFRRLGVHRPKGLRNEFQAKIEWVNGSGHPLPPTFWQQAWRMNKGTHGYDLVSVNHYAVRSAESFLIKRERGRVNHTTRAQGLAYWFRMNHNAEKETSIQRLAPAVAKEKAQLLTLPGVAEAHEAAVAWHQDRIARLLQDADYAAFYGEITSPRMEKLSRMATMFGMAVYDAGPHVIPDEVVARDPSQPFFFTIDGEPG